MIKHKKNLKAFSKGNRSRSMGCYQMIRLGVIGYGFRMQGILEIIDSLGRDANVVAICDRFVFTKTLIKC